MLMKTNKFVFGLVLVHFVLHRNAVLYSFAIDELTNHTISTFIDRFNISGVAEAVTVVSAFVSIYTRHHIPYGGHSAMIDAINAGLQCYSRVHKYGHMLFTGYAESGEPMKYPHLIKIVSFKHVMTHHKNIEWVLWLDADARITNFDHTIQTWIQRNRSDVHVVALAQNTDMVVINNAFLVRNSAIGKRFLHLWHRAAHIHHSHPCFDQVGFQFAMLRLVREFSPQGSGRLYTNQSENDFMDEFIIIGNATDGGCVTQQRGAQLLKQEISTLGISTKFTDDSRGIVVGPLFIIPLFPFKRPVIFELAYKNMCVDRFGYGPKWPLPFITHSKYCQFCELQADRENFKRMYMKMLSKYCSPSEVAKLAPTAPLNRSNFSKQQLIEMCAYQWRDSW